jgi:hypothetical protein
MREQGPELAHGIQALADDVPDIDAALDLVGQRWGDKDIDGIRCKLHLDSILPVIG